MKLFYTLFNVLHWSLFIIAGDETGRYFTFNGTNYIRNSFKRMASSSRELLQLEFKTNHRDGHLFYAGNRNYGISASLKEGQLRVSLRLKLQKSNVIVVDKINSPHSVRDQSKLNLQIESSDEYYYPFILNDYQWHFLQYERCNQTIKILLDDQLIYEKRLSLEEKALSNLEYDQIVLGNSYILNENSYYSTNNRPALFIGSVSRAIFRLDGAQLDIIKYALEGKHNFKIESNPNGQPILLPSKLEEVGVTFSRHSLEDGFLKLRLVRLFDSNVAMSHEQLEISFLTNEFDHGLLLHLSHGYAPAVHNNRFIAIEFDRGQLVLIVNFDDNESSSSIRHGLGQVKPVKNNLLIEVNSGNSLRISLNHNVIYHKVIGPLDTFANLRSLFGHDLFIGGMNFIAEMSLGRIDPQVVSVVSMKKNFIGSIQRVTFNGEDLSIETALLSKFKSKREESVHPLKLGSEPVIRESCHPSSFSYTNRNHLLPPVCLNNGVCTNGYNRPICKCDKRFTTGLNCEKKYPTIAMSGYINTDFSIKQKSFVDHLEISFQTIQSNGLLFSTHENVRRRQLNEAEDENFFAVHLRNDKLIIIYKINNKPNIFKLTPLLNDGNWHSIDLMRRWDQLEVLLDNQPFFFQLDDISKDKLLKHSKVVLGKALRNVLNVTVYNADESRGFVGNIRDFCFNGLCPIEYDNHFTGNNNNNNKPSEINSHRERRNVWSTSTFSSKVSGENSPKLPPTYPISFSSAECYLQTQSLNLYDKFIFQFAFKTSQPNGLILYNEALSGSDFIAFELTKGHLQIVYNMGMGIDWLKIDSNNLADKEWHQVILSRNDVDRNILCLEVDPGSNNRQRKEIFVKGGHQAKNFDLKGPLYLGGAPKETLMRAREHFTSQFGFHGCLGNFSFNNGKSTEDILEFIHPKTDKLQLTSRQQPNGSQMSPHPSSFKCIRTGCDDNLIIDQAISCFKGNDFCYNGGECLHHWNEIKCFCEMTTFTGQRCNRAGSTIQFSNSIFDQQQKSSVELIFKERQSSSRDEIALGFQTEKSYPPRSPITPDTMDFIRMRKFNYLFKEFKSIKTLLMIDSEKSEDYLHLLLINGVFVVEYDVGGGPIARAAFDYNLDDGFYHRILLHRNGPQMQVVIDNTTTISITSEKKAVQFNNQKSIHLGHYPDKKIDDYFSGYFSGIYINGLQICELISSTNSKAHFISKNINSIKHIPDFQPNLRNDSVFQLTNNIEEMYRPDIFHMNNNKTIINRFQGDAEFKRDFNAMKTNKSDKPDEEFSIFHNVLLTFMNNDINTWLVIILSISGILMTFSLLYMVYKCRLKTKARKYVETEKKTNVDKEPDYQGTFPITEGINYENSTLDQCMRKSLIQQQPFGNVYQTDNWIYHSPGVMEEDENILITTKSDISNQNQTFLPTGFYLQR